MLVKLSSSILLFLACIHFGVPFLFYLKRLRSKSPRLVETINEEEQLSKEEYPTSPVKPLAFLRAKRGRESRTCNFGIRLALLK